MKQIFSFLLFITLLLPGLCTADQSIYDFTAITANGEKVNFSDYKGKVLLATNVATKCASTHQLEHLEELYQKYKDKGFVVLAFPTANFSKNEPTNNEGVHKFCTATYGVNFPVFEYRSVVKGSKMCPIFDHLTSDHHEDHTGEVGSDFEKFLIDRKGSVRARYGPFTNPMSMRLTDKLEELLAEEF